MPTSVGFRHRTGLVLGRNPAAAFGRAVGAAGDNVVPRDLRQLLDESGVRTLADLTPAAEAQLHRALVRATAGRRRIAAQVLCGGKFGKEIGPPDMFQVLGQVFVVDNYVMSRVVYDAVPPRGMERVGDVYGEIQGLAFGGVSLPAQAAAFAGPGGKDKDRVYVVGPDGLVSVLVLKLGGS